MSSFPILTMDSAPDASKPLLQGATKAYGFTVKRTKVDTFVT